MDGLGGHYAKGNKLHRDLLGQILHFTTYMWNLKKKKMNEYNKIETDSEIQRMN